MLASNSLAVRIANAVMTRWPDPNTIAGQLPGWEYNPGIVLRGIEQVWRHTNDARYLQYIQRFTDEYVSANGTGDDQRSGEPQLRQPAAVDLPAAAVPADGHGEVQDRRRFDPRALRHDPARSQPRASGTSRRIRTRCGWTASTWASRS
jgi:hypothetical protein